MKDYYKILGIEKDATTDDVKKAYKQLAKTHHPDHGGDEEKFKEINEAHSVLSDPQKRGDYDNPRPQNPFGAGHDPFGDIFSRMHRQRRPDPNAPRRGRNIVLEHELPLKFFILGGKFKVNFNITDPCGECGGSGAEESAICGVCNGSGMRSDAQNHKGVFIQSHRPCDICDGRGRRTTKKCDNCGGMGGITGDRKAEVTVPAGTREGQVMGVVGQGGKGLNGGPPGDLVVKVFIKYPKLDDLTDEQKKVLEDL